MSVQKYNEFNKITEKKSEIETKFGWVVTVVTKEDIEKAIKSKVMVHALDMGKHFKAKDKEELSALEAKYKEGEKLGSGTIAKVIVQKDGDKFESYF